MITKINRHTSMPAAGIASDNAAKALDAISLFAELDWRESRIATILAANRMDAMFHMMLIEHRGEDCSGLSRSFRRVNAVASAGLIAEDLWELADSVRWLRNRICHRVTRADWLTSEAYGGRVHFGQRHPCSSQREVAGSSRYFDPIIAPPL